MAELPTSNFIRDLIAEDLKSNKYGGRVATRFPPEPNGYLHIGHAKAICIDFGLAKEQGGTCNLRFDDTNPTTEDVEYVESIQEDVRWLGFSWSGMYYASDYFEQLYKLAERLIEKGLAYVDSSSAEEMRDNRGDYFKKGVEGAYRNRSVAENLDLFRRMRKGEFPEGAHVLRAKIDLASPNMNLRDPVLYRIRYAPHHRTGKTWCIYPMYDYAHPISDALEKITHSICTLEFEAHRPLYDWCIANTDSYPSQQIEFARLHLSYTVMSKRKLAELVRDKHVSGWDDPRMPTLAGLRRRGVTAEAIRTFCERIGVARADSVVDVGLLEYCVREELNRSSPRYMGVLRPLKVTIENFDEGVVRELEAPIHPEDPSQGTRKIPFSKVLYIERDDFREDPPKDWFRLAPGREVRLRYGALVTCKEVKKDAKGEVVELICTFDPASYGGTSPDGRVVKGTLHWVSAAQAVSAEVRLYDRLFKTESPGTDEGKSFVDELNPDSLVRVTDAKLEPHLARALTTAGQRLQLERLGYFCVDKDSAPGKLVLNRTVTLKDTWAKLEARAGGANDRGRAARGAQGEGAKGGQDAAKAAKGGQGAAKAAKAPAGPAAEVTIDEFQRIDLRVGVVKEAALVEGADKLLRLQVDLGEGRLRQILSGIRSYYPEPAKLVGQRVIVVANLKPRQMKFGLSEGMILAAGGPPDAGRPHRLATFADGADAPLPGDSIA